MDANKAQSTEACSDVMPSSFQTVATVVSQRQLAHETFAIRVDATNLARVITPGQFFMIRPATGNDPLLGRPFALYDTIVDENGTPTALEFVYHVIGKMTGLMSHWTTGESVELWGPLGNGFPVFTGKHLMCVGGGIGYTPFLAVAREALGLRQYGTSDRQTVSNPERTVTLCYGVQSKVVRADLEDFSDFDRFKIQISTDDGSEGHHGFVTDLLSSSLNSSNRPDAVYCCGPEPMMQAVAEVCEAAGVACWLSLETPMACGFGACFSCVTKVRTDDGWDYLRTCVEGPVFRANDLLLS